MIKKKILKPIKEFCKKYWQKWTILAVLGMVIYIGFIFYQYIYTPIYQPSDVMPQRLEIKKEIYQQVMDFYFERGENIEEILR